MLLAGELCSSWCVASVPVRCNYPDLSHYLTYELRRHTGCMFVVGFNVSASIVAHENSVENGVAAQNDTSQTLV